MVVAVPGFEQPATTVIGSRAGRGFRWYGGLVLFDWSLSVFTEELLGHVDLCKSLAQNGSSRALLDHGYRAAHFFIATDYARLRCEPSSSNVER